MGPPSAARAVTVRAVGLALLGVAGVSALVSYNDHTLANTPLIGNYLPVAALLLTFFLVVVNAAVTRVRPGAAMTGGELCVFFSIVLVGCAVPCSGLMRYFVPSLVMPAAVSGTNAEFRAHFLALGLPEWVYPTFRSSDRSTWATDPVVTGFQNRWNDAGGYPYLAFVRPLATWGVFFGALGAALLGMVYVVRRQWVENERLPFPLAQIQMALIAAPGPGNLFNETLRHRGFWLAFGAVFLLQVWNGLAVYTNYKVPLIPTGFDLKELITSPPLSYAERGLTLAKVYLTAAAVTFFLRPAVGFSLWGFYLLQQVARMWLGAATGDPTIRGQADVHFGGFVAFTLMAVYTGRQHFLAVFREAVTFRKPPRAQPELYGSAAVAARVVIVSVVVMVAWLVAAGCTLAGAGVIVGLLMMLFFGLTRIVAEVGILHNQFQIPITRPFTLLNQLGFPRAVPMETYYHAQTLQCVLFDQRESLPVYASHALKVADTSMEDAARRDRLRLAGCFVLALLVAYPVSAFFHLRNEYTHASTLGTPSGYPIDPWGASSSWAGVLAPNVNSYARGGVPPSHNPLTWFGGGFVAVTALYAARLQFPGWPLHPIGLLMVGSYPLSTLWLSFLVGWLAKVLLLRFGGVELYGRAKPLAVGVILGESLAAAAWMVTAMVLSAAGLPYVPVRILPP